MTLDQELQMSYYKQIADIEADHGVYLVQDVRSKKFFVKKVLPVYDLEVFAYLKKYPIANTPRIYEMAEDEDVLILIEEYIPGDTLQDILDREGPLPEKNVLDIVLQLCDILEDFHACRPPIVNRDIKPSNIKLTDDGVVKLLDLNTAKRYKAAQEKDTVLIGTQGYAAPEQYGFGSSSVLTDIYALGVLMNVLLTAQLPGSRTAEGRLRRVIEKCTQLSPKERYQSVTQLRRALGAAPEDVRNQRLQGWRRFLPPGFRSRNPINWLLAVAGYALWVYMCTGLEVENAGATEVLINRICFAVISGLLILFSGNYLGIQNKISLTRGKKGLLRLLGIAAVNMAILFAGISVMLIIVRWLT